MNFGLAVGPRSLIFQMASYRLVGLKALNQPFKGSINPSVKSIMSLVGNISSSIIANL
jgi:hypothetical protein